jgi:hypothetical protein
VEIYNCFLFKSSYDEFEIGDEYLDNSGAYATKYMPKNYDWTVSEIVEKMLDGSSDWSQELKTNIIFLYDKDGIFGYGQTKYVLPDTPTNFEKGHYSGSAFLFQIINKFNNKYKRIKLKNINSNYIGNRFSVIDKKYYIYIDNINNQDNNLLIARSKKFNLKKYSYFISFAHVPNSILLAKRLNNIFEALGYKVWLDEKSLTYKNDYPIIEIKAGIRNSEKIIVILNKEYFYQMREWTVRELYEILTTKSDLNIKIIIIDEMTILDIKKKFIKRLQEIDDFSNYVSKERLEKVANLIYQIENVYYMDTISGKNIKQIISEL